MEYVKRPVVIEAFRWTGDQDQTEDPVWIIDAIKKGDVWFEGPKENAFLEINVMKIKTLEGNMQAQPGDFIIKGIKGEIYPCKPEIFEATYNIVEHVEIPPKLPFGNNDAPTHPYPESKERMTCAPALKRQLADAINRYCVENDSNTPDFILAEFIVDCLDAFSKASRSRENWFGKALRIGDPSVVDVGPRTAG